MPYRRRVAPLISSLLSLAQLVAVFLVGGRASAQTAGEPPLRRPVATPKAPPKLQPGDAVGQEIKLPTWTWIYLPGQARRDHASPNLVATYKSLTSFARPAGHRPDRSAHDHDHDHFHRDQFYRL